MYHNVYNEELAHHGIKGQKWGVRRFQNKNGTLTGAGKKRYSSDFEEKKAAYKTAKKAYNKAFNKADTYRVAAWSPSKKQRQANDERWDDAFKKGQALNKAEKAYKKAKATRKNAINKTYKDIQKQTSFGEKLVYNDATRRKAAKYVVDNNMTVEQATKRAKSDANRNTIAFVAAYGAIATAVVLANRR